MTTLHHQLQARLHLEKIQEALALFLQSGHQDGILLQSQFTRAQKMHESGAIDFEAWQLVINRIHYILLELTSQDIPTTLQFGDIEEPMEPISQQEAAPLIRQKIKENNLAAAILFIERTDEAIGMLLSGQLLEIQALYTRGLVDFKECNPDCVKLF